MIFVQIFILSIAIQRVHSDSNIPSSHCQNFSRDCQKRENLCHSENEVEKKLMEKQCPKTCNVCVRTTDLESETPGSFRNPSKCVDQASDCEERRHLCKRTSYKRMMTKQCALTCGFCSNEEDYSEPDVVTSKPLNKIHIRNKISINSHTSSQIPVRGRTTLKELEAGGITLQELVGLIRNQVPTENTTEKLCLNRAYDCEEKLGLCNNKSYHKLMIKLCPKSCNLCDKIKTVF